jgi:protein TonB
MDTQKSSALLQKACSLGDKDACSSLAAVPPAATSAPALLHAPTKIPKDIEMIHEEAPPAAGAGVAGMQGMGIGDMGGVGQTPAALATTPHGPVKVSSGTIAGTIISKPEPVYPAIAKAAHAQGAVVLHAIISKEGMIENLSVISGNGMLVNAARDAVSRWRYRPYLINGAPVEVETTITVNFTFGDSPSPSAPATAP